MQNSARGVVVSAALSILAAAGFLAVHLLLASDAWAAGKCGAEGQRPCKVWERVPSCDKGLYESFKEKECRRRQVLAQCGGEGQRPCRVWERIPSCNEGLSENLMSDSCRKPEKLLTSARRIMDESADILEIAGQAALCLWTGHKGLLTQAGRHKDDKAAMRLLDGTCLAHTMREAKRKGYRTLTVGIAADAAKGFGVSGEVGVAYDTAFEKPLTFYHSVGISAGAQAGAGLSVAIGVLRAANDDIAGDGHGFVMGAKKLQGLGAGVWFGYDGEYEGTTAVSGFGGGANAFAYNRTTTKLTGISRNSGYPGKTSSLGGAGTNSVTLDLEAGKIANDDHAKEVCPGLAQQWRGTWTGDWKPTITLVMAVCRISIPRRGTVTANLEAGPIWHQNHAKEVCPEVARRWRGTWTGGWATTVPGQMSVCQLSFEP
jgi:ribosome modulation factor